MKKSKLVMGALLALVVLSLCQTADAFGRRGGRCGGGYGWSNCYGPGYYSSGCYSPCNYGSCCCSPCGGIVQSGAAVQPVQPVTEARRVHCLFVYGTQDPVTAAKIKTGGAQVEQLFRTPVLAERVATRRNLEGAEATPANILRVCEDLPADKDDSIFVFYCGHGGTIKEQGHCLLPLASRDAEKFLPGEALPRRAIAEALKRKSPRFICFVTDACSSVMDVSLDVFAAPSPPTVPGERPAIVRLMLENKGVLDINACSYDEQSDRGEVAFLLKDGGLFTKEFVRLARTFGMDRDADGALSWKKEFLPELSKATDAAFQRLRVNPNVDLAVLGTQEHQTPQRYSHDQEAAADRNVQTSNEAIQRAPALAAQ